MGSALYLNSLPLAANSVAGEQQPLDGVFFGLPVNYNAYLA
jgi:hypothetical protein